MHLLFKPIIRTDRKNKLPSTGKFAEFNRGAIHWIEKGNGEPIVLIHELGGNHHNFSYMLSEPGENTELSALMDLDQPGQKEEILATQI